MSRVIANCTCAFIQTYTHAYVLNISKCICWVCMWGWGKLWLCAALSVCNFFTTLRVLHLCACDCLRQNVHMASLPRSFVHTCTVSDIPLSILTYFFSQLPLKIAQLACLEQPPFQRMPRSSPSVFNSTALQPTMLLSATLRILSRPQVTLNSPTQHFTFNCYDIVWYFLQLMLTTSLSLPFWRFLLHLLCCFSVLKYNSSMTPCLKVMKLLRFKSAQLHAKSCKVSSLWQS